MSRRSNVYFLGGRPAEKLGGDIQHFDVCTMPYVVDDYTKYIYPGRCTNIWPAAGRWSTPIHSVEEFRNVINIAAGGPGLLERDRNVLSAEENTSGRCRNVNVPPANTTGSSG